MKRPTGNRVNPVVLRQDDGFRGVLIPVEHYGLWGGGVAKAAFLLAREIRALGLPVRVLTLHTTEADIAFSRACGIAVSVTPLNRGHRWRLPLVSLALVSLWHALIRPRWLLLAIGTDPLAGYLLGSPYAKRLVVWECTEAQRDNPFVSALARSRLHRALAVLAPSAAIETNIRREYGYRGTLLRLPFWVETPSESCSEKDAVTDWRPDFIYVGRKDQKKGLFELIGALGRLHEKGQPANLLICGTGEDAPFRHHAENRGIADRVRFAYFSSQDGVRAAICSARWFVLPSHHEGYPLALLEAFSLGRPAIATAVGSVPEMCEDSTAALLVPPRDEAALCDALARALVMSSQEYRERSAAAHNQFGRLSGVNVVRQRMGSVLREVQQLTYLR